MNDSASTWQAVTQVQQQIWSKGDFAMVAGLVYNRQRGARRGARHRPRRARPRRRLRQRQRRDRGGAARLGQHGRRRLRPGPARARPRARRGRAARVEFVEADAQDLPFEDGELRRRDVDLRRDVRRPTSRRPRPSCCGCASPAAGSGWPTGRPDGAVGKMFMTIAKHAPPPPGVDLAAALGHRGAPARAVRRRHLRPASRAARSRASRSAPPTTTRVLPHLLRPDPDGLRAGRARRARRR